MFYVQTAMFKVSEIYSRSGKSQGIFFHYDVWQPWPDSLLFFICFVFYEC